MRRDVMSYFAAGRTLWAAAVALALLGGRPTAAQETVLYTFTGGADGGSPFAGLIRDPAGNLYGTTGSYGASCCGTVFKLGTNGKETVLYSFTDGTDGGIPANTLARDSVGNLYGTTGSTITSDGTVFKLDRTGKETVLYTFTSGDGGTYPWSNVIPDSAGNLYGTAHTGGVSGYGTVFKLSVAGEYTVLYGFTGGVDGVYPQGNLVRDSAGNLYGSALGGGSFGDGTVFMVDSTGKETVLYSFTGSVDGAIPYGGVIRDAAGNIYGTTYRGGAANAGVAYKLDTTGKETVLHSFTGGADGANPWAGVIRDAAGNFYGTTLYGGTSNWGTVFKVDTSGNETVLHSFTGGADGAFPLASLVQDSAGNLYGTTGYGGIYSGFSGYGTVFEIQAPSSPAVEITPSYLVFPGASSTLPLTVTNSGTAALNITVPQAFSGFNSFDFAVASGTTCTNGTIVSPGNSCIINITFTPLTTSAESAALSLFDNAGNSPQMVPLSGGAPLASISPNPVPGSSTAQAIKLTGTGFAAGAALSWQDLTNGGRGTASPLSVTANELTAALKFTNATAAWQIQVANPGGALSNWLSFEVLGSKYAYVEDDYPFQNATIDARDPYEFPFRECTSFMAWRMNRDAGTTNPTYPYFFNKMDSESWGNAGTWNTNALSLGYAVNHVAQVGAIAQWVNGCGGACANGHVAYVEQVNQDGSIVVSEYNFPENATLNHQFNIRTIPASSKVFPQNFIHALYVKLGTNLLNFGNQAVDTSGSLPVTVTNPTGEAIAVAGITIAGTNKGDFTQISTCGSSIPPGESCQITVTFTPMAAGARSAVVKVRDTAGAPIAQTITLMGSGT